MPRPGFGGLLHAHGVPIPDLPLSDLIAYLIGDDGLVDAGGGAVSQWSEHLPGMAFGDLVQATPANRPIIDTTSLADRTGVKFVYASDVRLAGSLTPAPITDIPTTMHLVVVPHTPTAGGDVALIGSRGMGWNGASAFVCGDGYWGSNTPLTVGVPSVITMINVAGGSPGGLYNTYLNGVLFGTPHDSGSGYALGPLVLGAYSGGRNCGDVTIYAAAVYYAAQTAHPPEGQALNADGLAVVNAFKAYYGIV